MSSPSGLRADPSTHSEQVEAACAVYGRLAVEVVHGRPPARPRVAHLSLRQARLERMTDAEPRWRHICEVCGVEEILTPSEAFDLGWDYPPRMGKFGVVGPRCCPRCPNVSTVWWALVIDGYTEDMLTDTQRATVRRIASEPNSVAVEND